MSDDSSILQDAKEAILDNEHSIGEKAPGTPFAIVALSYLGVLAVGCGVVALVMWSIS